MKVAVTSQGENMQSEVDPRFGRAGCFIVVDTETGDFQVVDNSQNLNATQGAGIQAAQTVTDLEVDAVLTGHCGPKAFHLLATAGVKVYLGVKGTVEKVVDELRAGGYSEAKNPDVEGHW